LLGIRVLLQRLDNLGAKRPRQILHQGSQPISKFLYFTVYGESDSVVVFGSVYQVLDYLAQWLQKYVHDFMDEDVGLLIWGFSSNIGADGDPEGPPLWYSHHHSHCRWFFKLLKFYVADAPLIQP